MSSYLGPSPEKHSPTLYSFPKAKRFVGDGKANCPVTSYIAASGLSNRATSLGYGHKYDFAHANERTPPPTAYQPFRLFDQDKVKGKGVTFGLSREQVPALGLGDRTQKVPGPGQYEPKPAYPEAHKYSIPGSKFDETIDGVNRHNPGPGAYQPNEFAASKYPGTKGGGFSHSPVKRFDDSATKYQPGPGSYLPRIAEINGRGDYFVSRFRSTRARPFGSAEREKGGILSARDKTPGPGHYGVHREFEYPWLNKNMFLEKDIAKKFPRLCSATTLE